MIKQPCLLLLLGIMMATINWSRQPNSIDGRKKQQINFYGSIELRNGNTYSVENISIKYDHQKIIMYEIPTHAISKESHKGSATDSPIRYRTLTSNPKDAQREIDLAEVQEIRVPEPDTVYTYKPEKGSEREYIALVVVLNDPPTNTERKLLIEHHEPLRCDERNPAGPQEAKYSFNVLVKVHIDGYHERVLTSDKDSDTCQLVCKKNQTSTAQKSSSP